LRAGAGLLRRRDLRQLRRDGRPRDRRIPHPLGPHGAVDDGPARVVAAGGGAVSAVVLPLQPEPLAGGRVPAQPRALRLALVAAVALLAAAPARAYDIVGVRDGGTLTGTVRFVGTPPKLDAIPVNQVRVKNSDPVLHNTHGFLGRATVFNLALPTKDQMIDVTKRLQKPGVIRVLCDAHPHMSAWMIVHDSPYVTVTDDKGAFKIGDV